MFLLKTAAAHAEPLTISVIVPNMLLSKISCVLQISGLSVETLTVLFFMKCGTKLSCFCIYFKYNTGRTKCPLVGFEPATVAYFIAYTVTNIKASSTDS